MDKGIRIEDFRLDNVRERFDRVGDLWKPLLQAKGRVDLSRYLEPVARATRSRKRPASRR